MIQQHLKKFNKSKLGAKIIGAILFYYLRLVYLTSSFKFTFAENYKKTDFLAAKKTIFPLWHQQIAIAVFGFKQLINKVNALVSSHSDGKIIATIVNQAGYDLVEGSSSKGAVLAVKQIFKILQSEENLVITPDGPRGPAQEINSNLIPIAIKTDSRIVPVAIGYSNYIEFASWDKFKFPLPFGKIQIYIDNPLALTGSEEEIKICLQHRLNNLTAKAYELLGNPKPFNHLFSKALMMFASIILLPFTIALFVVRVWQGKERKEKFFEKLGCASSSRPEGKLIWIHAASVGECILAFTLIKLLRAENSYLKFLITSGTLTSMELGQKKLGEYNNLEGEEVIIHQIIPFENYFTLNKFLHHWQPNLAICIESELWPFLINTTSRYCPLILANARMSDRSFRRWQSWRGLIKNLLKKFKIILAQSQRDYEIYNSFRTKNIISAGNLKYIDCNPPIEKSSLINLENQFKGRKLLLAASTHLGEEQIIIESYKRLKADIPNLLLLLAPRHPYRAFDISNMLSENKLNYILRSKEGDIEDSTDIYLIDTVGELELFFALQPITFMGGSFTVGGHNILEAARHNSAIVFGPDMGNFKEITEEFLSANAALQAVDKEELTNMLKSLLLDERKASLQAAHAYGIVCLKQQIGEFYTEQILQHL